MKKVLRSLISLFVVLALTVAAVVPAGAARPGAQFLSELHLAEADSMEDAKKMLTDKGYSVYEKNLNPEGDTVVLLGYKTSTNVEDAITDISVMNMNGGYNITSYDTMLKESFEEYKQDVENFRIAANEFKANYEKGTKNALTAYRQLNFYYVENKTMQRTLMGDYMLHFPLDNDNFADILLKGNVNILSNLRSLLAMGVGSGDILDRVKAAAETEGIYDKVEYYDLAKKIHKAISNLDVMKAKAEENIADIKAEAELDEDAKNVLLSMPLQTLSVVTSIEIMLSTTPYGDTNYYEYATKTASVDYSAYFPFVEAMTPGQRALTDDGQFISVLLYDAVDLPQEEIDEKLNSMESEALVQSVYLGTDLELFEGSFAVTEGAIHREKATGTTWLAGVIGKDLTLAFSYIFTAAGLGLTLVSTIYLVDAISSLPDAANAAGAGEVISANPHFDTWNWIYESPNAGYDQLDKILDVSDDLLDSSMNNSVLSTSSTASSAGSSGASALIAPSLGLAAGVLLMALSIYQVTLIENYYKVEYTDIPLNMVENVTTENGDRYILYHAVNSFYSEDGEIKERAGDTNGYAGQQWNAIYYTKNYEAGKCMLATADWPTNAADFGKYAPVHPFGEPDVCYNLNDFSFDNNKEIYLAFRTSNEKKAADTSVPTIVGSIFSYGSLALSAVAGMGIGMGIMALVSKKKKEKIIEQNEKIS